MGRRVHRGRDLRRHGTQERADSQRRRRDRATQGVSPIKARLLYTMYNILLLL